MKLYCIADSYIDFLRTYDNKVLYNKSETRPYVGIILSISGINYYAPLSSPKTKHKKMKNSLDFRKIKNGDLGAINLNNMIPVPETAVKLIDINNLPDIQYKRLLQNQYRAILGDYKEITKTAYNLRNIILADDKQLNPYLCKLKSRCCDLKLLEEVYTTYSKKTPETIK